MSEYSIARLVIARRNGLECLVIPLINLHADAALLGYANACQKDAPELADELRTLAERSGCQHPNCIIPLQPTALVSCIS